MYSLSGCHAAFVPLALMEQALRGLKVLAYAGLEGLAHQLVGNGELGGMVALRNRCLTLTRLAETTA